MSVGQQPQQATVSDERHSVYTSHRAYDDLGVAAEAMTLPIPMLDATPEIWNEIVPVAGPVIIVSGQMRESGEQAASALDALASSFVAHEQEPESWAVAGPIVLAQIYEHVHSGLVDDESSAMRRVPFVLWDDEQITLTGDPADIAVERAFRERWIVTEQSPIDGRTIAELGRDAAFVVLLGYAGGPGLVLVGVFGLVVLRFTEGPDGPLDALKEAVTRRIRSWGED